MKKEFKTTIFSLLIGFTIILVGCDSENEDKEALPDVFSKSFVSLYLIPDTLSFWNATKYTTELEYASSTIGLDFDGKNYYINIDSLSAKYNDTTYNNYVSGELPNRALAPTIESISVVSDADYDDKHLAGSCLNDIARISFRSYVKFIRNGYKEEGIENYELGGASGIDKSLTEMAHEDRILWVPGQFCIYFPEKPTLSNVHNLTFTFVMDNGKTLTRTTKFEFK